MRRTYLLAAGLLTTGGQIAQPLLSETPDHVPPTQPPEIAPKWDLSLPTPSLTRPIAENSALEFSALEFNQTPPLATLAMQATTELERVPTSTIAPSSNTQLYYQRLAALKAGQTYTRLASYSFQKVWQKNRSKPSYEQWKRLLAREADAIATGQGNNRLSILVGDSLSMWFPNQQLPEGQLWLNQGISGDTSRGILQRLGAFSRTRPDKIYLLAGINDLRRGESDATILHNLQQIMRRLRQQHPQSQILVQSILPTRLDAIPNQRIRRLNQQIAEIAQQEGVNFLNLHQLFADDGGSLRPELTTDGLHLDRRGYQLWQVALQRADQWIALNQ